MSINKIEGRLIYQCYVLGVMKDRTPTAFPYDHSGRLQAHKSLGSVRPGLLKNIGFHGYRSAERPIVGENQQHRYRYACGEDTHR